MRKIIIFFIIFLLQSMSGCAALLLIPVGGLVAHTVQKSNEDYDNIIVNMGFSYKQYYTEMEIINKGIITEGKPQEQILTFDQWIETQAKTDKEKKAVDRYKRTRLSNP